MVMTNLSIFSPPYPGNYNNSLIVFKVILQLVVPSRAFTIPPMWERIVIVLNMCVPELELRK